MIKRKKLRARKNTIKKSFSWLSISQIIANFSQLALLVAAVFGYYFTVKPLYTKAVLEEEIAKNKITLQQTEEELNQINKKTKQAIYAYTAAEILNCVRFNLSSINGSNIHSETAKKVPEDTAQCVGGSIEFSDFTQLLNAKDRNALVKNIEKLKTKIKNDTRTIIATLAKKDKEINEELSRIQGNKNATQEEKNVKEKLLLDDKYFLYSFTHDDYLNEVSEELKKEGYLPTFY